jgi:hypothetical protein
MGLGVRPISKKFLSPTAAPLTVNEKIDVGRR